MTRKNTSSAKKPRRGRPPIEVKKIPFQIMLDPRYIKYFRKVAKEKKIQPQDLARMALTALIPDLFNFMPSVDVIRPKDGKESRQRPTKKAKPRKKPGA